MVKKWGGFEGAMEVPPCVATELDSAERGGRERSRRGCVGAGFRPGGRGEGSQPRMPRAWGRNHGGDRAPETLKG